VAGVTRVLPSEPKTILLCCLTIGPAQRKDMGCLADHCSGNYVPVASVFLIGNGRQGPVKDFVQIRILIVSHFLFFTFSFS
jgi:hypothetical protein